MYAAEQGHLEVVTVLVQAGANVKLHGKVKREAPLFTTP